METYKKYFYLFEEIIAENRLKFLLILKNRCAFRCKNERKFRFVNRHC